MSWRPALATEFLVALTASLLTCSANQTPESLFKAGIDDCRAGNFFEGAKAFRDSLSQQPASGTLLNLGIAEWRSGQAGAAVLSWEQAAWIDPFDANARNNLNFARTLTGIDPPDLTWYETASTWLPANAWAWLAGGSLWLAVGMVMMPGILRIRKAGWHQGAAAIGFCIFLFSLPAHIGVITRSRMGVVLYHDTSLRLTPTQDAETLGSLDAGESARMLRARGNYLFIRTERGNGWVERNQIGMVCNPSR